MGTKMVPSLTSFGTRFILPNSEFKRTGSSVLATQNAVQGISGWGRRRKSFPKIAATGERNEEDEAKDYTTKAKTLEQLDQQLATLAERDDSPASYPSLDPSTQQIRPTKRQPGEQGKDDAAEWPEFSAGFLGFFGFAMLLLTVLNNILYRATLGPPAVPFRSGDPVQSSADAEPRYRITTLSEEREERRKEAAKSILSSPATESTVAPALRSE